MKLTLSFTAQDVKTVQQLVAEHGQTAPVQERQRQNVDEPPSAISQAQFWKATTEAILSSQQAGGVFDDFVAQRPYPLAFRTINEIDQKDGDIVGYIAGELAGAGLRFPQRRAQYIGGNFNYLAREGGWKTVSGQIKGLIAARGGNPDAVKQQERQVARHLMALEGVASKQSRNILQKLGLTKYEIPIDSRVMRALRELFGFQGPLRAAVMSDPDYYEALLNGIQALCEESGVLPCILDAILFNLYG